MLIAAAAAATAAAGSSSKGRFMDIMHGHNGMEDFWAASEDQRRDIQRTWAIVQELQDRLSATGDRVTVLQDGQRDTNRGLNKVQKILSELSEDQVNMKQTMERTLEVDINSISDDLRSTSSGLKQVRTETQALTASLRKEMVDRGVDKNKAKDLLSEIGRASCRERV